LRRRRLHGGAGRREVSGSAVTFTDNPTLPGTRVTPLPSRERGRGRGGNQNPPPSAFPPRHPDTKKPAQVRFCSACQSLLCTIPSNGASGENRTPTLSPEADFESAASTNSATEA